MNAGCVLPEEEKEVIVCTKAKNGNRNVDKGYYSAGRWVHRGTAEVTHWMELPNLPESEETER